MIENDIISSKDLPDEYHQQFFNLTHEISEALEKISANKEYKDPRLFLSAMSYTYASLLAIFMRDLGESIDPDKYLVRELEVIVKNVEGIFMKYKTPGI